MLTATDGFILCAAQITNSLLCWLQKRVSRPALPKEDTCQLLPAPAPRLRVQEAHTSLPTDKLWLGQEAGLKLACVIALGCLLHGSKALATSLQPYFLFIPS
jgi:hypothetical protein